MSNKSTKHYIITGLLSILPIALTYWIILKLFQFFANPGTKIVATIFKGNIPQYIPELAGFILTISFIYFTGILISNVLGKQIYGWFEKILSRIPFVNTIYRTIKQITSHLSSPDRQAFKKVVFIEYPRKGIWTLSMVTGESINDNGELYYHIFIPTTPNPTSGFLLYIPKIDTLQTNMSIEEGMKIIISGGILAPKVNQIDTNNSSQK